MTDILIVLGTRPEAIKLFPVIAALRERSDLAVRVCATGQHRELLDPVLKLAGIRPDIDLGVMRPDQSLDALTAKLLTGVGQALDAERPRRVVVQGDTATAMATTLATHHRRIAVSHVEAGLRSADLAQPWPEEGNRRIIAAVADQHFAPTESAVEALRRENIDPSAIHLTGNTVIDALHATIELLGRNAALGSGLDGLAKRATGKRIVLATTHRRENRGEAGAGIAAGLRRLAQREDVVLVVPLHPSGEVRAPVEAALSATPNVELIDALDYPHFVRLLSMAHVVLTDSGGVQEEAPALGKPVLVLRRTTERPEGVAAGTARLVGTDPDSIVAETERLLEDDAAHAMMARTSSPYGDGKAAERIAALLEAKLAAVASPGRARWPGARRPVTPH